MKILEPSILAADFWQLGKQIEELEKLGITHLHVDVMDGMFVPSISFGMPVLESVRRKTSLFLDVHLMIEEPDRYIEEFAKMGADLINFHIEATKDAGKTIELIKKTGRKTGITIKPDTDVEVLEPYFDKVDMILVMTVEPGFGGQKILPKCIEKVRKLREMTKKRGLAIDIEVDGGVTIDNIREVTDAGANVIVAGSAVFKNNIAENVAALLKNM